MASTQERSERDVSGTAAQEMGEQALGPAVLASVASVGLSWYYFFIKGDRHRGLFVGLWPPTILAFASYFNQRTIQKQLETLTRPGTTLKNAIDSMISNE